MSVDVVEGVAEASVLSGVFAVSGSVELFECEVFAEQFVFAFDSWSPCVDAAAFGGLCGLHALFEEELVLASDLADEAGGDAV